MKYTDTKFNTFLGYTKVRQYGTRLSVFLEGFEWSCGWYWSGGFLSSEDFHAHFDGAFLDVPDIRGHILGNFVTPWTKLPEYIDPDRAVVIQNGCSVWEGLTTFLDDVPPHIDKNWWRIKDLYRQFYRLRDAAEVFQHGGHCTSDGRTEEEIQPEMAKSINDHIYTVIIPEIVKALSNGEEQ